MSDLKNTRKAMLIVANISSMQPCSTRKRMLDNAKKHLKRVKGRNELTTFTRQLVRNAEKRLRDGCPRYLLK